MRNHKREFGPITVIDFNVADIDVEDTIHVVAIHKGCDTEPVRSFDTMSCDLEEIAYWLPKCGVDTIAMESTKVYWKCIFSYLVERGIYIGIK